MVRQMTIQFKNTPSEATLSEIEACVRFIRKHAKDLIEMEGDSKWTKGNLIFRETFDKEGMYTFMVGALASGKVTLHIMPLYAINEFKEKYKDSFAPFSSGKSCIQFKHFKDLPKKELEDIIKNGSKQFKIIMQDYYKKRNK